jgi:KaiC/GvpD/RAD55 family RecA-like ATPase
MGHRWKDFLRGGAPTGHAVQIYDELDELAESVAAYLAAGFDAGEPAIVVATREHLGRFTDHLGAAGWDTGRIEAQGLLTVADADSALRTIMRDGDSPSEIAFEALIGTLLDQAVQRFPGRTPRVFGEMVDRLCQQGRPAAAIELEELWNRIGQDRHFSLLCGYHLNVFDRATQSGPLPDVCRVHSHVMPTADEARLTRAVDLALDEVLGAQKAGHVYGLLGAEIRQERVPMGQLALMWVSANMPVLADRVLASARAHYAASARV